MLECYMKWKCRAYTLIWKGQILQKIVLIKKVVPYNVKRLELRFEFPWFGAIIEQNKMITKWKNRVDFLLRSTTYTKMDQIWQNACVLWIRQLTWKQDFSRVNNRREVQLDKDAWNTLKFKKIKKKCHFKKIECS